MERTIYETYNDNISLSNLHDIEQYFKLEEIRELNKKVSILLNNMIFENFESRSFAEKMFRLGYLAAHLNFPKQ